MPLQFVFTGQLFGQLTRKSDVRPYFCSINYATMSESQTENRVHRGRLEGPSDLQQFQRTGPRFYSVVWTQNQINLKCRQARFSGIRLACFVGEHKGDRQPIASNENSAGVEIMSTFYLWNFSNIWCMFLNLCYRNQREVARSTD